LTTPTGKLYYVAVSGSDDNPGTLDQPWRTVQHAADSLAPGDTVYIREGTYHEHVVVGRSGSPGAFITLAALAGESPNLDGQGFDLWNWGGVIDLSGQSYVRVSGLRVINSAYAGIFVDGGDHLVVDHVYTYNTASSGIAFFGAHNVLVDSNEVVWAGTGGVQEYITIAGTQNFEVRYNHVHGYNPATGGKEGIDAKDGAADGSIHHNHVHDLDQVGIYVDAYSQHTYDIQVYANRVHDVAADGLALAAEAGGLLENIRLENNLSYHNENMGLRLSDCCSDLAPTHPMTNIRIVNNTFYDNGWEDWGGGVYVINPHLTDVAIRNNIVSQNLSFQLLARDDVPLVKMAVDHNLIDGYRGIEGELYGQDYVEGDPLFVGVAEGNFHFQPGSPAIDGGAALDAPELDFDGNLRPLDGDEDGSAAFDIGAYEVAPGFSSQ
jgi:hypothetical protein